MQLSTQAWRTN